MTNDREDTGATADDVLARMAGASVDDLLRMLREHTGLDVAFVGEFSGDRRIIRYVSGPGTVSAFLLSRDDDVVGSYCRLIVQGDIAPLVPDVRAVRLLRDLPITAELGIGSYIGVPIHLGDGDLYGTLCCFGHEPVDGFDPGVLDVLRFAASFVARKLEAPEHCYSLLCQAAGVSSVRLSCGASARSAR